MTIHFGVLIPSTNTTTETEFSRLPAEDYQAHYGRVLSTTPGRPFASGRDEDIDYQSKLLGTARVEMVVLIQTSASLWGEDYDAVTMHRMSAAAGVPAMTSALALGRGLRALGARRIGLVSPYSEEVNARCRRYLAERHGLEIVALDCFAATDSYAIGQLGPESARAAFVRIDRPEIEAFALPGGNFATLHALAAWERELGKPIVTSNQASLWAVAQQLGGPRIDGCGRLLEQLPAASGGRAY
jgi:maleate cis-trans isomerase